MKKIDDMFAELGTPAPKITSIKGKHIGRNDVLIEWLEGQVAKKRNDGSKRETPKAETKEEPKPEQKTTHRESAEPEPQQDAKQSGPVEQEKPKSTPPPAGDFSNW